MVPGPREPRTVLSVTALEAEVFYSQRTSEWAWRVCWGLLALIAVVGLLISLERGLKFALTSALVCAAVWGIPVWVAMLTLFSIDRYGKIRLTREALRVGRATVATAQIDLEDLLLQAREDQAAARRWAHVLSGANLPATRIVGQAPMLGGSYGSTFGSAVLTIRLTDVGWRQIDVKRWGELLDGLLRVRTGQDPLPPLRESCAATCPTGHQ